MNHSQRYHAGYAIWVQRSWLSPLSAINDCASGERDQQRFSACQMMRLPGRCGGELFAQLFNDMPPIAANGWRL
jgi:hypothetical protein